MRKLSRKMCVLRLRILFFKAYKNASKSGWQIDFSRIITSTTSPFKLIAATTAIALNPSLALSTTNAASPALAQYRALI